MAIKHPVSVRQRLERLLFQLAESQGEPTPQGLRINRRLTESELASLIGTWRSHLQHCLTVLEREEVIIRERPGIIIWCHGAHSPPPRASSAKSVGGAVQQSNIYSETFEVA